MLGMMYRGSYGVAVYDLGIDYANESLAISQQARLLWHLAPALETKSSILFGQGDYQNGIELITRAIEQARTIGALRIVSIALSNLGDYYQALNLLNRAEAVHSEGLEIDRMIGTDFYLPRIKADLAIDRLRLGNLGVGPDLEELSEKIETEYGFAGALTNNLLHQFENERKIYTQYTPVMKFILADKEKRLFCAKRMCYLGGIDDWIDLTYNKTIEELSSTLIPTLGTDEFFELY